MILLAMAAPMLITAISNALRVWWKVASEVRVSKYEVEMSKGNSVFTKVGEVAATNSADYSFVFPLNDGLKSLVLFIRLKSVDVDGKYQYSKIISVNGNCNAGWQLYLFPNPASEGASITIAAKEGVFNGKYKVAIIGNNGQSHVQKETELSQIKSFELSVKNLARGRYHITISKTDGSEKAILDFERL